MNKHDDPSIMTPEQEAQKKRSVLSSLKKPTTPSTGAAEVMDPAGIPFGGGGDKQAVPPPGMDQMGAVEAYSPDDFITSQPVPMSDTSPAGSGGIAATRPPRRRKLPVT